MTTKGKSRPLFLILLALIVTVAVLRFYFLPQWIKDHLDPRLQNVSGYRVTYDDLSVSIFTGSASINNVLASKENTSVSLPFFQADEIEMSLDFGSVFKGSWVSRVTVDNPVVNFVKGATADQSQTGIASDWPLVVNEVVALPVNEIKVNNGQVLYHDYHATPRVLLHMTDIQLSASNLQNANGEEKILSGLVEGSGKVADANITINIEVNSFFQTPTFVMKAELTNLNLIDVNDFLTAYGKVEVRQGVFSLYTQASTRNSKVIGFVKPLIEDVTFATLDRDETLLVRPSLIGHNNPQWIVTSTPRNLNEIHFEGNMDEKTGNLWDAIGGTLHNAFVEALVTMLEESAHGKKDQAPLPLTKSKENSSKVSDTKPKKGILRKIFKKKNKDKDSKRRNKEG